MAEPRSQVDALKEKGNACMGSGDYKTAIELYTQAIELDPQNHVLFSNRSAAYLKDGQYLLSLSDANHTIESDPKWPRGYSRKATCLFFLDRFEESFENYLKVAQLDPSSSNSANFIQDLDKVKSCIKISYFPKAAVFANLVLPFENEKPHKILWPVFDALVKWFSDNGCSGVVPIGLGTEYNHISFEDCIQVVKHSVENSKKPNVVFLPETASKGDIDTISQQMIQYYDAGASAIILSASHLSPNKSETELKSKLTQICQKIAHLDFDAHYPSKSFKYLGLSDSSDFILSDDMVYWLSSSGKVQIFVDKSAAGTRFERLSPYTKSLRILNYSLTSLLESIKFGYGGYIGLGSSFFPSVLNFLLANSHAASDENHSLYQIVQMTSKFLSLSEGVCQKFYPLSAKVFLKFVQSQFEIDPIVIAPFKEAASEDDVTKIRQLVEVIHFVSNAIKEATSSDPTKKGKTVLL